MELNSEELIILKIINQHGAMGWYRVHIALSRLDVPKDMHILDCLKSLVEKGLLAQQQNTEPSQYVCYITDKGKNFLAQ